MSVRDDVVEMLQRGPRVDVPEEPVDERLQAWATNLSTGYQELGNVAVKLAEHIDAIQEKVAALERQRSGETIMTRGASNPAGRG